MDPLAPDDARAVPAGPTTVRGVAQTLSPRAADRRAHRQAGLLVSAAYAAEGLTPLADAPVVLYRIDAYGRTVGGPVALARTDASGRYSAQLPGDTPPGSVIAVVYDRGVALRRLLSGDDAQDISPLTEAVYGSLVSSALRGRVDVRSLPQEDLANYYNMVLNSSPDLGGGPDLPGQLTRLRASLDQSAQAVEALRVAMIHASPVPAAPAVPYTPMAGPPVAAPVVAPANARPNPLPLADSSGQQTPTATTGAVPPGTTSPAATGVASAAPGTALPPNAQPVLRGPGTLGSAPTAPARTTSPMIRAAAGTVPGVPGALPPNVRIGPAGMASLAPSAPVLAGQAASQATAPLSYGAQPFATNGQPLANQGLPPNAQPPLSAASQLPPNAMAGQPTLLAPGAVNPPNAVQYNTLPTVRPAPATTLAPPGVYSIPQFTYGLGVYGYPETTVYDTRFSRIQPVAPAIPLNRLNPMRPPVRLEQLRPLNANAQRW